MKAFIVCLSLVVVSVGCSSVLDSSTASDAPTNVFDRFLNSDSAPSDGFDFPVGNPDGKGAYIDRSSGRRHEGWFIATRFGENYSLGVHPGEDWNGSGGADTDLGQDVSSIANGRVRFAENFGQPWGNMIVIEHVFYENHEKRTIRSLYAHLLEISVQKGDIVTRRQRIGSIGKDPNMTFPAHLHLELRWDSDLPPTYWPSSNDKGEEWVKEHYAPPSEFITKHRKLFVPQKEKTLVLVSQESYKMRLYRNGEANGDYEISLGQGSGQKLVKGDNKTPKGMYFVTNKHRGKFDGEYGEYYGGHWIKINYPNKYDAERGRADGQISLQQAASIESHWKERVPTLENTKLGGGIGFHGWIKEWENGGQRHLSWGCVVMHLYDITGMYEKVPEGTMVVIF